MLRGMRDHPLLLPLPLYLFFVVVFTVDLPLNYSPFVYALSTIIFKVKLSGYKSSNCVTESMRTITITDLTTSCIKLLPTIIYNASTAHLHTGEITGLSRSHSPPSINASHTVVAENPLTQWLTFPKNRFACHNVLITEESHLDCCCALWQRRQWSICISFSRIFLASYLHVDDGCTSRSSQKLNPLIF